MVVRRSDGADCICERVFGVCVSEPAEVAVAGVTGTYGGDCECEHVPVRTTRSGGN
jgi:hypothetical protein